MDNSVIDSRVVDLNGIYVKGDEIPKQVNGIEDLSG